MCSEHTYVVIEVIFTFDISIKLLKVGGGTKTRRPIALRMQYNPRCTSPLCFLTLENGKEEQRTLGDIQVCYQSFSYFNYLLYHIVIV